MCLKHEKTGFFLFISVFFFVGAPAYEYLTPLLDCRNCLDLPPHTYVALKSKKRINSCSMTSCKMVRLAHLRK